MPEHPASSVAKSWSNLPVRAPEDTSGGVCGLHGVYVGVSCPGCFDESLHLDGCYLPLDHEGDCHLCSTCEGDPEAHDLHVCGKEPFK